MPIRFQKLLEQPLLWKLVGFVSSVVGLLSYALSSAFKHVFGKWNLWKIIVYSALSFVTCSVMLFAQKWQLSRGFLFKAHVVFFVLMATSLFSFFYDKALNGKPDVLSPISSAAFALMSWSLSRQIHLGFEVGLSNFFAGCLTVQLIEVNLILSVVAAVFCYSLIVLRCYLDSQHEGENASGGVEMISHIDYMEEWKTLTQRMEEGVTDETPSTEGFASHNNTLASPAFILEFDGDPTPIDGFRYVNN